MDQPKPSPAVVQLALFPGFEPRQLRTDTRSTFLACGPHAHIFGKGQAVCRCGSSTRELGRTCACPGCQVQGDA